ncbi:MAG: hypothetical protein P1V35_10745 [Planctomycetota bacterium]|nr:hypothetical protein [Planctomycetota bacterium]
MNFNRWILLLGGAMLGLVAACSQPVPYQTEAPAMYTQALERAQAQGKWLLVDLGAPW